MDILTIVKANIRSKRGTFFSIVLLMTIIAATMTSMFSVRDNYSKGFEEAMEYADYGDTTVIMKTGNLTEELKHSVENSTLVESVWYQKAVVGGGISHGEITDGNDVFLLKLHDGIRMFNEAADGFEEEIPALSPGEIYLPLGLKSDLDCNVGAAVTIRFGCGVQKEFRIKGFVQEPSQGSSLIGWKQAFISQEDFEAIYEECIPQEAEGITVDITIVRVHQKEKTELSSTRFQRLLNLETGLVSRALGALTSEQSLRYSTLLPEMIIKVILVFVVFLFVIVLIVMSHSIGTEIELEYVTLGVLKSQGFDKNKIRLVFLLQYMLAELIGLAAGSLVAVPIEREISALCQTMTAVLPDRGVSVGKWAVCTLVLLTVSFLMIMVKTRKVAAISPVRAISGGREEIYFDSRLQAPVTKKGLSASLALRQFTSGKKRYFGTLCIVAILTFFMITVNLIGNLLASREALAAMGLILPDLEVHYLEKVEEDYRPKAAELVESYTEVTYKNTELAKYVSLNGENLLCLCYLYPESIRGILKGRAPLYENELLITDMVAEALEIGMGDSVVVANGDKEAQFIVSGIFQSGSDSGMTFAINGEGAELVGIGDIQYAPMYFVIEDKEKKEEIGEAVVAAYKDILGVHVYDNEDSSMLGGYDEIVHALQSFIYTFSILFAFVVVRMVCTRSFVQERRDIGIYKAIGFTSGKLRLGFALRFFFVSLVGAVFGMGLSILFSDDLLNAVLSLIGLTKVVLEFNAMTVLLPTAAIGLSFFVFAYLASSKIKRVAVRELVAE